MGRSERPLFRLSASVTIHRYLLMWPSFFVSSLSKLLLVVHNIKTGQDIIHKFCETDFAFELVEGSSETDENGDLDVESKFFYRLD